MFAGSVHAGNGCASCHADVDLNSHPGKPVSPGGLRQLP